MSENERSFGINAFHILGSDKELGKYVVDKMKEGRALEKFLDEHARPEGLKSKDARARGVKMDGAYVIGGMIGSTIRMGVIPTVGSWDLSEEPICISFQNCPISFAVFYSSGRMLYHMEDTYNTGGSMLELLVKPKTKGLIRKEVIGVEIGGSDNALQSPAKKGLENDQTVMRLLFELLKEQELYTVASSGNEKLKIDIWGDGHIDIEGNMGSHAEPEVVTKIFQCMLAIASAIRSSVL